ncbi:MAG: hypothetical protein ABIP94_10760 [Planctomycetota bacterium]
MLLSVVATQEKGAEVVTVSVPAAFIETVTPSLVSWFGKSVHIEELTAIGNEAPPGPRVFLLCDEWMLARLAAVGALGCVPPLAAEGAGEPAMPMSFVLPFLGEYALAVAAELQNVPRTWEELALHPGLHDRLGIVAPEVDGSPWLLGMRECVDRGQGQTAGLALWTSLDARAGHLAGSYATVLDDLVAGRLVAAVGPRAALSKAVGDSGGRLRFAKLAGGGMVRFGLAMTLGAGDAVRSVLARLCESPSLRALADATSLAEAPSRAAALPADIAVAWWTSFERDVRGRGRATEQLADWLDVSFGAVFLVCLWFVWRSCREPDAKQAAPS